MNYTVKWVKRALDQLAAVWMAAADRAAVTAASHRLEQEIAADPSGRGLPRGLPVVYTAIELPLGIEYEIVEKDKKVRILRLWSLE